MSSKENTSMIRTEETSQQGEKSTHRRKNMWQIFSNNYILLALIALSILVSTILISLIVSDLRKQSENIHRPPCCNMTGQDSRFVDLLNVVVIACLTSNEKEYNAESSVDNNSNGDGSLIHQEAYLDNRPAQYLKHPENLPWLVRNNTNTSAIPYNSHKRRFIIPKQGLYYVYVSLTFHYKNITKISNAVYRTHQNNDRKLLTMSKTVKTAGNGTLWSYYDINIGGFFHLYKDDELYMKTNNSNDLYFYPVCNYFTIFSIPA